MKYQVNLPDNWQQSDAIPDSTKSICQFLQANWSDRAIPVTAFFQLQEHRDKLLELGWLEEVKEC